MMACNTTIFCAGQMPVTSGGPLHDSSAGERACGCGARFAARWQCTRASQKRTSSMSFAEKHPYLFWQLIGWGILLIDFVFVVIAVFNDFGEWS